MNKRMSEVIVSNPIDATTVTGDGAPTDAPFITGQEYIDLTAGVVYRATGTTNAADWKAQN